MSQISSSLPLNQLLQGDCLNVMQSLPPESIDVIFADPPYNLQLEKGHTAQNLTRPDGSIVDGVDEEWDRFQSLQDYDTFSQAWLKVAKRILKPNGTIWVMGSYHNIFRLGSILQDLDYWVLNDIIWVKSNPMPNFRGRRFTNAHETLIWCVKEQSASHHFEYQAMKALNNGVQMRSDWYLPICNGKERLRTETGDKVHPTQKPEALLYRILLASTKPGDIVLDPFSGTGTTACVAKKLRRNYIGIERDTNYLNFARTRLAHTEALAEDDLSVSQSPANKPRIPFGRLIENGLMRPGDHLESPCKKWRATVRADGSIACGDHQGSIHQVGAKLQGSANCNGWTYWQVRAKKSQAAVISLDSLRQKLHFTSQS
ncbi:MAG: site-specific DNA-methyltransferase [Alphaproteobacteria bacterium]|nr:site-specific DNA-methyltransferase [Alphaproteobacteria bacterium]